MRRKGFERASSLGRKEATISLPRSIVDILDVIKKEHREVAAMLDQADRCNPGDRRLIDLAKKIEAALSTHVKIEERLFYSRLRKGAEEEDQRVDVYEAYTEHDVADHLIQLLKSSRKPDEKFKAEMQVLGESVKHHVKEEESTVFSIARELMDQRERNELGDKWMKARERIDAETTPRKTNKSPRKKASQVKGSRKK
jgi:hemerythrin-like domain-containing protein